MCTYLHHLVIFTYSYPIYLPSLEISPRIYQFLPDLTKFSPIFPDPYQCFGHLPIFTLFGHIYNYLFITQILTEY